MKECPLKWMVSLGFLQESTRVESSNYPKPGCPGYSVAGLIPNCWEVLPQAYKIKQSSEHYIMFLAPAQNWMANSHRFLLSRLFIDFSARPLEVLGFFFI